MNLNILREGSAERGGLDKIQGELRKTHQAIEVTARAPLPIEETRARMQAAFQHRIYSFSPEQAFEMFAAPDSSAMSPDKLDFAQLLYIFGPDEVLDLVMKRLAATGKSVGLPAAKRATKLREFRARIEDLEGDEEREILRLEEAGHVILRRDDVRPEVLFQVWAERGAEAGRG